MAWAKPTSVTLDMPYGIYDGTEAIVRGSNSYKYVYVGGAHTGWKYWLKGSLYNGMCIVPFDADPTVTTYKEFQIILSNTEITNGTTLGGDAGNYVYYFRCPAYACKIYNGSTNSEIYDNYNNSNLSSALRKSGWTLEGLSTSRTSSYAALDASWSSGFNGETFYAIHSKDAEVSRATCYYYRGTSTRNTVTVTDTTSAQTLYGTGQTKGGTTSTSIGPMTTSCAANSSYSLIGWSISSNSSSVRYYDAEDAFNAGYGTIYGVYEKSGGSSNSTVYYYRGSGSRQSCTKTTTTADAYYYGTGYHTGGGTSTSYGSVSTSCLSDSSYSFQGWATSSSSRSPSYSSATSAFNAGYSTIYGVYLKDGSSSNSTCYYYRGNSTRNSVTKTTTVSDAYYYGTGSHYGGTSSNSYGSIDSSCAVSGWTFEGWATSASTQQGSSSSATSLFNGGSTTIYGTYSKEESMTYYPQNGSGSSSKSTTNYRYGTGSVTSNRPSEPSLTYADHTFQGWGTSSGDTTPETWNDLWDAGTRTVYAIWVEDYIYNVFYGVNGVWKQCKVWHGENGEWKLGAAKVGVNNAWKQ